MLRKILSFSVIAALASYASVGFAADLPKIGTYVFTAQTAKTAVGTSTQIAADASGAKCKGNADAVDTLGSLNVYAAFYQNGCYTGGGYGNSNYPIEMGALARGTKTYTAYRVSPATTKATSFLASHHRVRMKFDAQVDYDLYTYDNNTFAKTCHIPGSAITLGQYVESSCLPDLDAITKPTVYFALKSSDPKPTTLKTLSTGVAGANLAVLTGFADLNYYTIQQPDTRTPNDLRDSASAPGGFTLAGMQYYNLMAFPANKLGVVWQDRSLYTVYLTTLTTDRKSTTTVLPKPTLTTSAGKNYVLGSAATDELGNLYYVLVEAGNPDPNYNGSSDPTKALSVVAMKLDAAGAVLVQKELNGTGNPLQVTSYGDLAGGNNMTSLQVSATEVGIMLSRQYPRSSDGLNHQGSHAYVLDRDTLALKKDMGQTASHSMSHMLTESADGLKFNAIEIGDNYPRGINLHRFTSAKKDTRVVYTFKTAHGQTAKTLSNGTKTPPYQIDAAGKQTYKWSNDNRIYTELAGVAEDTTGYSVIFAGEHDAAGKVLDNRRAISGLNDAHNIGFVKIRPDFEKSTSSGTVIPDNLVTTLNGSTAETGEYYDYGGGLNAQRVTGIKWLTNYTAKTKNASRVKTMSLPNGNLLVLWEEWSDTAYLATKMMVVNAQGDIVTPAKTLSSKLRFHKVDKLFMVGNAVWAAYGNKTTHQLELIEFKLY